MANIPFKFMRNPATGESKQEQFFALTCRNQCFSGGYGNGKSYIGCFKAIYLLSTFPNYRMAILRASSIDLKRTTMATFFKVCPPELYDPAKGGNRVDSRNYLRLTNGSEVFWMHLDEYDDSVVRGLEINSYLIDQAEEIDEGIYLHLDSRLDRWDVADVPEHLHPERYPKNEGTGKPKPPAYGMILCNPDAYSHWIYRRFHPDSSEHTLKRHTTDRYTGEKIEYAYSDTHTMIQATSYDNPALSAETLRAMESRGQAFVDRFVLGKWGIPGGQIHEIQGKSKLIDPPKEFMDRAIKDGQIYFAFDYGTASPSAGLWIVKYKRWLIAFQEYYKISKYVSEHRENIGFLNAWSDGIYLNTINVCDPSMGAKTQQKKGGLFSLIDDFASSEYKAPPIHFQMGDNNEFLTRSRINEVLRSHPEIYHPITGEPDAPILYFVMKTAQYPHGCAHVVSETEAQKHEKIGTVDGEDIYGDEREKSVVDHAYDTLRYNLARIFMGGFESQEKKIAHEFTFKGARNRAIKMQKQFKKLAGVHNHSHGKSY